MLLPGLFTMVTSTVLYPVHVARLWIQESTGSFPQFFRDRKTLLDEITLLERQLSTQTGSVLTIRRLQTENTTLRTMLGASTTERRLASVIARPNTLPYDVLQIDVGSAAGIVENAPVFLGRDQVIGFVSHVSEQYAFVQLVTTAGFESTAYIIGPDIYTRAEGMGGGVMRVRVPQGVRLEVGNMVVLPAVESGVYGTVSHVEALPTQAEQYGYVTPDTPLQSIRFVSVGLTPIKEQSFVAVQQQVQQVQRDLFVVPVPPELLMQVNYTDASSTATSSTADRVAPGVAE